MSEKRKKKSSTYRKATYPSALRMARLVDEMPRHGLGSRLSSVAEVLGVSEQTVKRYVKALNDEFVTEDGEPQFVIKKEGDEEWLVRRRKYSDASETNIYHLISVYLVLEMFRMLGENVVAPTIEQVMEKVEMLLPPSHRTLLNNLPRKFFAAPSPHRDYSEHSDVLNDVMKAIVYQDVINILYKGAGKEDAHWIEIKPLTLMYHRGSLYVNALAYEYDDPWFYGVERIQEVEFIGDKFEYPDKYHPMQKTDGAFGIFSDAENIKTFKIKFPPELADYITCWKVHHTQKFKKLKDGSVVLTMTVTDSEEVRSWIRSFGDMVSVVE